jgi:hypothetical protein
MKDSRSEVIIVKNGDCFAAVTIAVSEDYSKKSGCRAGHNLSCDRRREAAMLLWHCARKGLRFKAEGQAQELIVRPRWRMAKQKRLAEDFSANVNRETYVSQIKKAQNRAYEQYGKYAYCYQDMGPIGPQVSDRIARESLAIARECRVF